MRLSIGRAKKGNAGARPGLSRNCESGGQEDTDLSPDKPDTLSSSLGCVTFAEREQVF